MNNLDDLKARMVPGQKFAIVTHPDDVIDHEYIVERSSLRGVTYREVETPDEYELRWRSEESWAFSGGMVGFRLGSGYPPCWFILFPTESAQATA